MSECDFLTCARLGERAGSIPDDKHIAVVVVAGGPGCSRAAGLGDRRRSLEEDWNAAG